MNPPNIPTVRRVVGAQAPTPRSAEELRRNSLNMEKMIKKNVMAASRPGGMKRGMAVVEYFKQQRQQQQTEQTEDDTTEQSAPKRMRETPPPAPTSVAEPEPAPKPVAAAAKIIKSPISTPSHGNATPSASLSSRQSSPLRQAFASPSRLHRASPLRQAFTSPSRRFVSNPLPEVPASALDQVDITVKSSAPPAKSPFQSFQSKLGKARTNHPPLPPQPPQQFQLTQAMQSPSPARSKYSPAQRLTSPGQSQRPIVRTAPRSVVDLTDVASPRRTVQTTVAPPPKPLARSLFSSFSGTVATKSICFTTEGVASSIDVSPDGECIVVAFTDGSVRMYEMESTVPSDRHGYLLGHLDEESNQSSAGAHLRVKISNDGRYAFVGCRSGPRVMMSINLHHYRNGKDTEDDDVDQLQKSFHSNARLRGFSDAMKCPRPDGDEGADSYFLLCGLGVGTLNLWQFVGSLRPQDDAVWKFLYSIPANGNTAVIASFLPGATTSAFQIAARCEDKNVRVWSLEGEAQDTTTGEEDSAPSHVVKGHHDVPHSKDVVGFYGKYAYGISPSGVAYRFAVPTEAGSGNPSRTQFDMERIEGSGSSKSRRATIMLESVFASDDGQVVVAVSTEGIFYYTKEAAESGDIGGVLKIIGRNSSMNTQFKSPMKVYRPQAKDGSMLDGVMAVVTNPDEDDGEGYFNVDLTETWSARWMVPSQGKNCWVCGVRNISHWQQAPESQQAARKEQESKPAASTSKRDSLSKRSAPAAFTSPASTPSSPIRATPRSQTKQKSKGKSAAASKPPPVKRIMADGSSSDKDTPPKDADLHIEQELARYKERYNQIVTEWKRRLKGERQMRRLWKQREQEFEAQLQETTTKLDANEQEVERLREAQKDSEKRFIFEKLKAEQQSSVKVRYEQLCEQMQERMVALEHQQRLMEQTTRSLLQEVDRHVQHSKQSVNGLVERQQNECILCKDRHAVTAIVPCGHLCFCEEDADVYRRNFRGGDQITCPICQREMISMLRIY
ncbi:hypothetical protein Poli38472_001326 [Pythium oligandrum]|uniref:RING-type domain-containing protein n=1 Tax=Pythium oligandrum TaxID=41045 RepID=A0A8K1CUZ8_PYTOL|nr:hypothetical protein Poli38472_001326 [Pythium oligandrum]|eukprot:TMW69170.1 hypothetical protein Poli38472_001326 [Pythium oligandrum]